MHTIYSIVKREIEIRKSEYEDKLTTERVYAVVSPLISVTGENVRSIKYKVQQVIEEFLFQGVIDKDGKIKVIKILKKLDKFVCVPTEWKQKLR